MQKLEVPDQTGIGNLINQRNSIQVHPNPADDFLKINFSEPYIGGIQISDTFGRVLMQQVVHNNKILVLKVEQLPTGIYFIYLEELGEFQRWVKR